jgi:hypothetical protein
MTFALSKEIAQRENVKFMRVVVVVVVVCSRVYLQAISSASPWRFVGPIGFRVHLRLIPKTQRSSPDPSQII